MTFKRPLPASSEPAPMDAAVMGEIIQMALSDDVSFDQIQAAHGLSPDAVKVLMRQQLAAGSYRAWRKRVRKFSDQRANYN